MVQKKHITKIDENIEERGIQNRSDNPSTPVEGQVWYNSSDKTVRISNGSESLPLNIRIIAGDPISPQDGDIWINSVTNKLKYMINGTAFSIPNATGSIDQTSQSSEQYIRVLTDAELKTLSDINSNYPTYLIESFHEKKESVTLTDTEVSSDRLQIVSGASTGVYEREVPLSSNINFADGIAVVTTQPYAPKTISSNDVILYGDLSAEISAGEDIIVYDVEEVEGLEKQFYLLNLDGTLARLTIDSVSYDSGNNETTVSLLNPDALDITRGFATDAELYANVRISPLNVDIEVGAEGITGSLTAVGISSAYSSDVKRVLGDLAKNEVVLKDDEFLSGNVKNYSVKASPNGQYVLIAAEVMSYRDDALWASGPTSLWKYAYSTDGMKTISVADYSSYRSYDGTAVWNTSNDQGRLSGQDSIEVSDNGEFLFAYRVDNASGIQNGYAIFGNFTNNSFNAKPIPSNGFGSGAGFINANTTVAHYLQSAKVDFNTGYMAAYAIYASHDAWISWYELDFQNLTGRYAGYRFWEGSSTNEEHEQMYPMIMDWIEMEGELCLIVGMTEGASLTFDMSKFYASEMFASSIPTVNTVTEHPAFSDSTIGGVRASSETTFINATAMWLDGYHIDRDEGIIHLTAFDDTTRQMYQAINFGRTRGNTFSKYTLNFASEPTVGEVSITLDTFDYAAEATPETVATAVTDATFTVATFASTLQARINTAIGSLTNWAAGNYVTVTANGANYTDGFDIDFENLSTLINTNGNSVPMVLSINTDTSDGTASVVEDQEGLYPIWLTATTGTSLTNAWDSDLGVVNANILNVDPFISANWSEINADESHQRASTRIRSIGKTVYNATTFGRASTANTSLNRDVFLTKIPDYTQCLNLIMESSGTIDDAIHIGDSAQGVHFADGKIAQKFTVPVSLPEVNGATYGAVIDPTTFYSDSLVPIRTIKLKASKYTSTTDYVHNLDYGIRMNITGDAGVEPDELTIVGTSKTVKFKQFPGHDDEGHVFFNFDTVKLTPGNTYWIVCELVDESDNPVTPSLTANAAWNNIKFWGTSFGAGANGLVYSSGVWSDSQTNMHFSLHDSFIMNVPGAQNNDVATIFKSGNSVHTLGNYENIMPIIDIHDSATKTLSVGYRHGPVYRNTSATDWYTGTNSICFAGKLIDSDPDLAPTFEEANSIGYDKSDVDLNTKFAMVMGHDSTRMKSPRDTDRNIYSFNSDDDKYITLGNSTYYDGYNTQHLMGGVRHHSMSVAGLYAKSTSVTSDVANHIDTEFMYDSCAEFAAGDNVTFRYYASHFMGPGQEEFSVEAEYNPMFSKYTDHNAATASGTSYSIFRMDGILSVGVRNGKYYISVDGYATAASPLYESAELVADEYQRVRFGRSNSTGLFIKVFNGSTWDDLTLSQVSGDALDITDWAGGRHIGLAAGTEYLYISGVGRVGYVKLLVGSDASVPKTDGVDWDLRPVTQPTRVVNDMYIASYIVQNSVYNGVDTTNKDTSRIQKLVLSNVSEEISSKVSGFDHIFKYKTSLTNGQDASLKITLSRIDGVVRPPYVQGTLFNYQNK